MKLKYAQATLLELSFGMQARWLLRPIMGIWNKYVKSAKVPKPVGLYVRTFRCGHTHAHRHTSSRTYLFLLDLKAGMAARSMYACDVEGK